MRNETRRRAEGDDAQDPPRTPRAAAASHSASVGGRAPAHRHEIFMTGAAGSGTSVLPNARTRPSSVQKAGRRTSSRSRRRRPASLQAPGSR